MFSCKLQPLGAFSSSGFSAGHVQAARGIQSSSSPGDARMVMPNRGYVSSEAASSPSASSPGSLVIAQPISPSSPSSSSSQSPTGNRSAYYVTPQPISPSLGTANHFLFEEAAANSEQQRPRYFHLIPTISRFSSKSCANLRGEIGFHQYPHSLLSL